MGGGVGWSGCSAWRKRRMGRWMIVAGLGGPTQGEGGQDETKQRRPKETDSQAAGN